MDSTVNPYKTQKLDKGEWCSGTCKLFFCAHGSGFNSVTLGRLVILSNSLFLSHWRCKRFLLDQENKANDCSEMQYWSFV